MAGSRPSILVLAGDGHERTRISATISEAGFSVVAAAEPHGAREALGRQRFVAAVLAPRSDEGNDWLREARSLQPGLPALFVLAPAAFHSVDEDHARIVKRPFDCRQLLGCVFELVVSDSWSGQGHHSHAAELGIAAAQLACLHHRRTLAVAAGSPGAAQDLTRQIGQVRSTFRGMVAAVSAHWCAASQAAVTE